MARNARLALSPGLVARAHRAMSDPGLPPGRTAMTDADYDALLSAILAEAEPGADPWLFAFGSLIWNPACEAAERKPATVRGWHRSFCMRITRYRGSPDRPGLMMALDRGGVCRGVAYRIPRSQAWASLSQVWRREMSMKPLGHGPRWLSAEIEGREVPVIGFVANRQMSAYVGRLALDEVATMLAQACGHWGSGAEYLLNTVLKLEEHGIRDRNLWRLQALVAERLMAMPETVSNAQQDFEESLPRT